MATKVRPVTSELRSWSTSKPLARVLGVGERYVRRLVSERQIEFIKVGHYVRFDLEAVRKWVEDRRRPEVTARG